ncbi:MAG TPA: 50S ribosomal protein L18 [Terriglobia bacterium]|nr:50S ribosomal protein L18 [Terriglobia bacterium]
MLTLLSRNVVRRRIHLRSRARVRGVTLAPRVNIFRSSAHIYAQIVDDTRGHTLVAASSRDAEVRKAIKTGGNVTAAKAVGKELAKRALAAGIGRVVFDRGGYAYHGRVKALADAAREGGLKF